MTWRPVLVALLAMIQGIGAPAGVTTREARGATGPPLPVAATSSRAAAGPVAAVLMDVGTGRLLYARDVHRRMAPASTTKILTAILAIERLSPGATITISAGVGGVRTGTTIGVEAGETWKVRDLLHAMMVRSANDAAVALAEGVSGKVERFVSLMNARARQIGARNSHFTNPHGLHESAHYTTAYDLALITHHALRHPHFAAMVSMHTWELARPDRLPQEFANTNKLLDRYAGADGVKTGWTAASGHTLVASATRDHWQLLAVVLKSQDSYRDVEQLLDYGFQTFAPVTVARRGETLASVTVGRRRGRLVAMVPADVHAVVRRGAAVSSRVSLRSGLHPPISAGERVGDVQFIEGQSVVARSALIAAYRVAP
ncbi:MAG: D-alanyl-D-alanine carboxypeptidase family protein [Armatimonadota bacterium]